MFPFKVVSGASEAPEVDFEPAPFLSVPFAMTATKEGKMGCGKFEVLLETPWDPAVLDTSLLSEWWTLLTTSAIVFSYDEPSSRDFCFTMSRMKITEKEPPLPYCYSLMWTHSWGFPSLLINTKHQPGHKNKQEKRKLWPWPIKEQGFVIYKKGWLRRK